MPSEYDLLYWSTMTATVIDFEFQQYLLQNQVFSREVPLDGDTAGWDILSPSRKLAKANVRDGASNPVPLEAVKHVISQCIPLKENKFMSADWLNNIRETGSDKQANARAKMALEQKALVRRNTQFLEYLCAQCLTGTLTVTQEDIKLSVDYEIPSDNERTAAADWESATWAQIEDDLEDAKEQGMKESGKIPLIGLANSSVKRDLMVNSNLDAKFGTGVWRETITKTGTVQDFCGLTLMFYDLGYHTDAGVFTKFLGDDTLKVVPAFDDNDWCSLQRGSSLINPDGSPTSPLVKVKGRWSRPEYTSDPDGVKIIVGDLYLPVLDIPGAVVTLDTSGP